VIVNKVLPNKFEKINRLVRKGLEKKGLNVLGVIPYNPLLARPTIEQIQEETGFQLLCGKDYLERSVSQVVVGAMEPVDAVKYIVEDSLVITPSDRTDIILIALGLKVAGIVLSGGTMPEPEAAEALQKATIPVLLAKSDTYDVATTIHDLTVKLRSRDTEKIAAAVKLIQDNVDLEKILRGI
jgi:BioD-like phosphotransacetylase family protein